MSSIMDLLLSQPSPAARLMQLLPMMGGNTQSSNGLQSYSSGSALMPGDPSLVTAHGVTLQSGALTSLEQARRALGLPLLRNVTSSYRTPSQQSALYAQKPGVAAAPGSSYHQQGLAIDLSTALLAQHPEIRAYLDAHGWNQFSPTGEPWHFSYGVTG